MSWALPSGDWIRHAGGLTVQPEGATADETVTARVLLARLITGARLVQARPALDREPAESPRTELPPAALALVAELAALQVAPRSSALLADPVDPAGAFAEALRDAAAAVHHCRRVQHPGGSCWFGDPQRCARVLAAAHQLG